MSYPPQVNQNQPYPGPGGPHGPVGQPGGPWQQAPQRPRRWIGVVVGVAAVMLLLVVGVVGLGAYLLFRDSNGVGGTSTPGGGSQAGGAPSVEDLRATAQAYLDAVNSGNEAAATKLTCEQTNPGTLFDANSGTDATWVMGESEILRADLASVDFAVADSPGGQGIPTPFKVRDGSWCVAI